MQSVKLNLKKRSYGIIVGSRILDSLTGFIRKLKLGSDAYVITNSWLENKYGKRLEIILKREGFGVRFKTIADTERSKSLESAARVIKDIAGFDQGKRIFIIAFGGGVIGDLAGFVASLYKRGIPYIQVPTTLLAQVDSSIGGKTAVDLAQGKNLLGAFYQPRLVFSDVEILKTLDLKQMRSGLAEVIKYAAIKDPVLFRYLEKRHQMILAANPSALEFVVLRCSRIKAKIVELDEKEEKGLRTILNFGHTLGHAIEAASGFTRYTHGESIALGMLVACQLSFRLGLLTENCALRIKNLIEEIGLPTQIKGVNLQKIIQAHFRDKKFKGKKNRFVLLKGIGKARIVENIPLEAIREAVKAYSL